MPIRAVDIARSISRRPNELPQLARALSWRSARKLGFVPSHDTMRDQEKDHIAPFDEYPPCEMCGSEVREQKLTTRDGVSIVECGSCGLWFTSPRISEKTWTEWLKTPTERSIEFTENRLKYGVSLTSNTKYALPDWYDRRMRAENSIIDKVERHLGGAATRIHDVGCGIGYLLQAAQRRGIESSGNELNAYAYHVMCERLGLDVYNVNLPELDLPRGTLDAVVMHDYIEHTYHPLADLEAAYRLLRPGGVVFIRTFHIDCRTFDRLRGDWNMLFWSHTFHFSTNTLHKMIEKAGFELTWTDADYENDIITLVASK